MTRGRLGLIAYVIFLVAYSWYKYSVAAPQEFSAGYAQSVVILVLMTGVAPFVIALAALKVSNAKRFAAGVVGIVVGLVACVVGYAAFWWLFIAPAGAAPAAYDVAARGVGWGVMQGALAALAAGRQGAATALR